MNIFRKVIQYNKEGKCITEGYEGLYPEEVMAKIKQEKERKL